MTTWDDAQKALSNFERIMKLIKKFPVKSICHEPEPTKWTIGHNGSSHKSGQNSPIANVPYR